MYLIGYKKTKSLKDKDDTLTRPHFDEADWIARLAAALETVAANAEPLNFPLPPEIMRSGPIPTHEYYSVLHRGYRDLAARAKHDPEALRQFNESRLWVKTDPTEARAILREHPLMKPGLEGSGKDEGVLFRILNKGFRSDLTWLVSHLAKLSVKEGGAEAARRLHRILSAGANACVPAYETIVFHGLFVKRRIDLGNGAYLAPYEHARSEFGLPEEPEPWPKSSHPNAAVIVRSLSYGPCVAPSDDGPGFPQMQIAYRFPTNYQIDLESWFNDSKLLVDLLSIAARVPLLSRTLYVRLPKWIEEIDPNFAFGARNSRGFTSDMWPKGRDLSQDDVDAFVALSRGWGTYAGKSDSMEIAIRRLAGSFSRPGGRFGEEDRILDVAIALEVFYGGKTGHKLAQRAAGLIGESAAEQKRIYDQAKRFYDLRSSIVHPKKPMPALDLLYKVLEEGCDLACRTLASLLKRDTPVQWADVMRRLQPETQTYIEAKRQQNQ